MRICLLHVMIFAITGSGCSWVEESGPSEPGKANVESNAVLCHPFLIPSLDLVDISDIDSLAKSTWPTAGQSNTSKLIHAIRAFHGTHSADFSPSTQSLIDELLADTKESPRFLKTRYGVRFFCGLSRFADPEAHSAQALSLLGELGIAPSTPLAAGVDRHTVQNLIADCYASFDLDGETEWKILSVCLYPPTDGVVKNRLGEEFSFNGMITNLLDKPPGEGSCGGCHVPYTLVVLEKLEKQGRFTVDDMKVNEISNYLNRLESLLINHQGPDGSLPADWGRLLRNDGSSQLGADSVTRRLLVTSHHLEWMLLRNAQLGARKDFFTRCSHFLLREATNLITKGEIERNYCALSHSIHVLYLLNGGFNDL